jgi:hypothetical protein
MGSLVDRLKAMKAKKAAEQAPKETDIEQCLCGSNLKGECDECDRVPDDNEVMQTIQEIGDRKAVNPPAPTTGNKAQKVKRDNNPGGICPTCNKEFKHLSRHVCKGARQMSKEELKKQTEEILKEIDEREGKEAQITKEQAKELVEPVIETMSNMVNQVADFVDENKETLSISLSTTDNNSPQNQNMKASAWDVEATRSRKALEEETEENEKYDLYVNCEIVHNTYGSEVRIVRLCDLISPMCEDIAKENQVEYWNVLDYAKGPAYLAAKLERYILADKLDCEAVVVDSRTSEGKACLDVLMRHAGFVVRGV